ncbi:MAG: RNA 2',3'-cyclic phosphodiesterase [Bacillota bacterium]|nr:RNA 2',3'-cyclic phosphodiesterase [Bacillota bacterium]
MRLFVAVELPPSLRRALGELVRHLAESRADVKWVEEENFHLTLKFLGEVDPARLAELAEALARAAGEMKPFTFEAAGTGAFPSPGRARVVWVGVGRGAGELGRLAAAVDSQLADLGFAPESRPFSPHLTVGRVRSPRGATDLARALEQASFPAREVAVEEIVLFQSALGRSGPVYTPLGRHRLG